MPLSTSFALAGSGKESAISITPTWAAGDWLPQPVVVIDRKANEKSRVIAQSKRAGTLRKVASLVEVIHHAGRAPQIIAKKENGCYCCPFFLRRVDLPRHRAARWLSEALFRYNDDSSDFPSLKGVSKEMHEVKVASKMNGGESIHNDIERFSNHFAQWKHPQAFFEGVEALLRHLRIGRMPARDRARSPASPSTVGE